MSQVSEVFEAIATTEVKSTIVMMVLERLRKNGLRRSSGTNEPRSPAEHLVGAGGGLDADDGRTVDDSGVGHGAS